MLLLTTIREADFLRLTRFDGNCDVEDQEITFSIGSFLHGESSSCFSIPTKTGHAQKQDEETGQYLPNGASAKSGLNKSILDAGWSTFIAMREYKAANAGSVQVVRVNPKYTSQVCSYISDISDYRARCTRSQQASQANTLKAVSYLVRHIFS